MTEEKINQKNIEVLRVGSTDFLFKEENYSMVIHPLVTEALCPISALKRKYFTSSEKEKGEQFVLGGNYELHGLFWRSNSLEGRR